MNRSLACFALVAVASASCASPTVDSVADVDDVAERAGVAVWHVESRGCGWKTRGSAFAIDARHLVTNRHVIANDSSPMIRSRDGKERAGRVIGASEHPDVAVIEVADDLPAHMPWARTASLAQREPLVVLGYPSPEYAFKASTGRIVNFEGPGNTHEAALVNAPIARGSSGGPGLRGDASVAGVVTRMTLPEKPEEQVAIVFTADSVRPVITKFLREPTEVLSTCGLGPDYVPPVPKTYDIKEAPPTAAPVEAIPVGTEAPARAPVATRSQPPPAAAAATTKPVQCPNGTPQLEVTAVNATAEPSNGDGWWSLDVRGTVRNTTSASIHIAIVEVRVDGDPPVAGRAGEYSADLASGQQTAWRFTDRSVYSPQQPSRAEATLIWNWAAAPNECASSNVKASGPNPTPTP